jgi:hypothetical protein
MPSGTVHSSSAEVSVSLAVASPSSSASTESPARLQTAHFVNSTVSGARRQYAVLQVGKLDGGARNERPRFVCDRGIHRAVVDLEQVVAGREHMASAASLAKVIPRARSEPSFCSTTSFG